MKYYVYSIFVSKFALSCDIILLSKTNISLHVSDVGLRGLNYCQGDKQLFVSNTTF